MHVYPGLSGRSLMAQPERIILPFCMCEGVPCLAEVNSTSVQCGRG